MSSQVERDPARSGFARGLLRNLAGGFALALLRRRGVEAWRAGGEQLIGLFVLNLVAGLAYDIYAAWPGPGRIDWDALPAASFWALPLLLSAWLVAHLQTDRDRDRPVLSMAVAAFALAALGSCASTALAVLADFSPRVDRLYQWLAWVPVLWVAIAWGIGAPKLAGLRGWRRVAGAALAAALVMGPQWTADAGTRIWVAADEGSDGSAEGGAGTEQVLYAQADLLEDSLDRLAPGRPGVTELYSITFAGSGSEDVFLSEALGVNQIMADLFDTADRSIVLANSQKHPGQTPFATVTALQRALATVAERMDESEDILFLFLTAHGSPDHTLDVSLAPYQLEQLTPVRLRQLLDESGIRFRVIVVSACYSGGFVRTLASPDTMVITASGADRASFGCRDGRQWTDFGRAYFKEALPATGSFEGALQRARELIAQREAAAKLTPSEPQISVGDAIRERLQALHTQRLGPHLLVRSAPRGSPLRRAAPRPHGAGLMPAALAPQSGRRHFSARLPR
ncbi:MAG TPA: C13 family peptidase [Burkholderiaceae bacterium]|nr:C13 family peptidase [Burkholderiaceae bacterium]